MPSSLKTCYRYKTVKAYAKSKGYELDRVQHATHEYELWSNELQPGVIDCCETLSEVLNILVGYPDAKAANTGTMPSPHNPGAKVDGP